MLHLHNTLRSQLKTTELETSPGEKKKKKNPHTHQNNTIQHITPKFWSNYTAYPRMLHITRAHKNVEVHRGALQMCILIIFITELA
jgi:hypothetical protein